MFAYYSLMVSLSGKSGDRVSARITLVDLREKRN